MRIGGWLTLCAATAGFLPAREVFLLDVELMRGGYTTGSCAAAGMKAALLLLLRKETAHRVEVINPQNASISVPIHKVESISNESALAAVIKDAGDDPDVTHGTEVITVVKLTDTEELRFFAGEGVGTVTKPGLAMPPGEPAINPGPRTMMKKVFAELCPAGKGLDVTISVPAGKALARKTLNATLGIEGGISIIGTTGIVKPMSEEAFKDSLVPQLTVMKAAGYRTAVLVPGRIGHDLAVQVLQIPPAELAETSNFIGFMLEQCVKIGFTNILIVGHIGKIVKLAGGSFHTHNRMSDGRIETLTAYAALAGADHSTVERLMACATTEAALPIIAEAGLEQVYKRIADRAGERSMRYIADEAQVGIILSTLTGDILAVSDIARAQGREEAWHIPSI